MTNNNDKNSEFLNNSIERKHRTSNYESNKNPKENDLEFERKYIQNSLKKSPIFERTSIGFEGSFQRENWRKIEDFIEPLSPPKLLYFDEEKVRGKASNYEKIRENYSRRGSGIKEARENM